VHLEADRPPRHQRHAHPRPVLVGHVLHHRPALQVRTPPLALVLAGLLLPPVAVGRVEGEAVGGLPEGVLHHVADPDPPLALPSPAKWIDTLFFWASWPKASVSRAFLNSASMPALRKRTRCTSDSLRLRRPSAHHSVRHSTSTAEFPTACFLCSTPTMEPVRVP